MKSGSANPSPSPSAEAAPGRLFALIPCAGQGSRAWGATPAEGIGMAKQYREIAGQSLVLHTLAAFSRVSRLAATWVVVAPEDGFFVGQPASFTVCRNGGASRAESVRNGLAALQQAGAQPQDWVLVHDAARCLITPAQIDALIDACAGDAVGGLLAHRVPDTLKASADGRVAATLDRTDKWLAQTPQMFRLGPLLQALESACKSAAGAVTDESAAMEAMGLWPLLVAGSAENFKVTYPEDFALAEAILLARARSFEARQVQGQLSGQLQASGLSRIESTPQ
ncbi:MAG: 2-C-methyl-D-erythritol 4-phosphate cytidylyltransferase [Polaromonas sp.]|nr:2-C-methyl-D-erythritol 4-phosphate cytidylyltransferase [Polaromonas sp.]